MKKRITVRARRTVIHTSTVSRKWRLEEGLDLCVAVEPDASSYPADAAGIDPRPLRRQVFPRVGGAKPTDGEEERGV